LLSPDKDPFNKYAHFLTHGLGNLIYVMELVMGVTFLIHLIYGIIVQWNNWRARPVSYKMVTNAKGASRKTIASSTMIYSGIIIVAFLVLHLRDLKFGEIIMYTTASGAEIRDLYTITIQFFQNTWNVVLYIAVMVLIGFHLSHGVWSAFQSLGANGPRFIRFMQVIGYLYAFVIAGGFILIPAFIYITGGAQ
jgi:succinate dehydrogenase / fumarate reductase cytochrome b subunit